MHLSGPECILHNNRKGKLASECCLVINTRFLGIADKKCLHAVIV